MSFSICVESFDKLQMWFAPRQAAWVQMWFAQRQAAWVSGIPGPEQWGLLAQTWPVLQT